MRNWIHSWSVRIRYALGLRLIMAPADTSKPTALLVFMSSRAISSPEFSAPSEVILTRDNIVEWCSPTYDTLKDAGGDIPSAEQMWSTLCRFVGAKRRGVKWSSHYYGPQRLSFSARIQRKGDVFVVAFSPKTDSIIHRIAWWTAQRIAAARHRSLIHEIDKFERNLAEHKRS